LSRADPGALNHRTSAANELENQSHNSQYEQNMNEPAHGVAADNSQQPEHEQDYENRPKHLVTSASVLAFLIDWKVKKEGRLSEIESCAKVVHLWPEKKAGKLFSA
jgi:hypothetical protein